jgi:hypothetical protein
MRQQLSEISSIDYTVTGYVSTGEGSTIVDYHDGQIS